MHADEGVCLLGGPPDQPPRHDGNHQPDGVPHDEVPYPLPVDGVVDGQRGDVPLAPVEDTVTELTK